MKRIIVFIIFATFSVATFCQETTSVALGKMEVSPPRFAGIENAVTFLEEEQCQSFVDYVAENFQYPDFRNSKICEGTEVVQFVVSPAGEIVDFKVINSLAPEIDAEIIRVLKSTSGMWLPGTSDEKRVSMSREISLAINCNGDRDFEKIARSNFERAHKLWFTRNKPEKALRHYNKGIRYRPYDESLLFMRGLCKFELGDKEGAREDWCRFNDCGGTVDWEEKFLSDHKHQLKTYDEVVDILKTKK